MNDSKSRKKKGTRAILQVLRTQDRSCRVALHRQRSLGQQLPVKIKEMKNGQRVKVSHLFIFILRRDSQQFPSRAQQRELNVFCLLIQPYPAPVKVRAGRN